MTVNFKLLRPKDKTGKLRTEPVSIQVVVCNKQSRVELSTGLKVLPRFWGNGQAKISFTEAEPLNAELDNIKKRLHEAWKKDRDIKGEELKGLVERSIRGESQPLQKKTVETWIASFIKDSKLKPSTLQVHRSTLDHLIGYAERTRTELTWESFDLDFYESFTAYLYTKVESDNTVGKIIKTVKTWLRASFDRGVHSNVNFQKRSFKVISAEVDEIYLSEAEIKTFFNVDLSDRPDLVNSKNLFVFGCHVGLRFADLRRLTQNNFVKTIGGDALKLITQKTGEEVIIPLHPSAKEIWDMWGGKVPRKANPKFNKEIKEIAEKAGFTDMVQCRTTVKGRVKEEWVPKHKMVKAHTCRRSFATNCYLMGVPSRTIMAVTGHKTEKAFKKYIRVTKEEHASIMAGFFNKSSELSLMRKSS